ncbi:glutathione S-transferase family protein [Novosphingobium sp. AP12]|uniref:glutathione S-transferase family protein n=1 Tax=Novosphingobium sp. AP12 TaxID=1144305 RepID=UPI000271F132|nr:glutathione S-transferase family protein [Novosphingobium sp. AP12]EJL33101.1 glutathione S-transferase [Novosphingobium sp. AP12]
MAYDFYWISGSPNAWRAMLALEYKGVEYVSHRLDPGRKEHKTPEFLALNPRGTVPVLNADGVVIAESLAIMAFLESAHPTPALFGETPVETGLIWQRIFEVVNYVRDPIETGVVRAISYGEAIKDPEAARVAAVVATTSLAWLEDILKRHPYLAGESVSAADIAAMPILQMLGRFGAKPEAVELGLGFDNLGQTQPAISAWLDRLKTIPGYDAAYPPHWRG